MRAPVKPSSLRCLVLLALAIPPALALPQLGRDLNRPAAAAPSHLILATLDRLPLAFTPNMGQADSQVRFLAQGRGYQLALTTRGAFLTFPFGQPVRSKPDRAEPSPAQFERQARGTRYAVVGLRWLGANPTTRLTGQDPLPGRANYLLGNNRAHWHTNVPTFAAIRAQAVYPGIDVRYHSRQGRLEYDLILRPGATPEAVRLLIQGARPRLDSRGDLMLATPGGTLVQHAPVAYQERDGRRAPVAARYALVRGQVVRLSLGAYDHRRPLVIDPILSYGTYLGGSGDDQGNSIAVDGAGNAYITGSTASGATTPFHFPTTPGAFLTFDSGAVDAFVTKLDVYGGALVYSTYMGGAGARAWGIAVDGAGSAYITGSLAANGHTPYGFPVTPGAFQTHYNSLFSAFAAKLRPDGTGLIYSTYLGGGTADGGQAIAVDAAGNAYVTGWTSSRGPYPAGFPVSLGAFQTSNNSTSFTAFVTKLNADGSTLIYSTYLGGSTADEGDGIAVDAAGNAYVTGWTASRGSYPAGFPTTPGAFQGQNNSGLPNGDNAFVTKLSADGRALVYSTYLGGAASDDGAAIAVDGSGSAYITGQAQSSGAYPAGFPTTPGAFQTTNNSSSGNSDSFVTKLNAGGSALVYSSYLGGAGYDAGRGIAVDRAGNAYVTGYTRSSGTYPAGFPITPDAYQTGNNSIGISNGDAFVTEFSTDGSRLLYSTYLGGQADDRGNGIAVDRVGGVYVTGQTSSSGDYPSGFPTTPYGVVTTNSGATDAFVVKLDLAPTPTPVPTSTPPPVSTPSITADFFGARSIQVQGWGFTRGGRVSLQSRGTTTTTTAGSSGTFVTLIPGAGSNFCTLHPNGAVFVSATDLASGQIADASAECGGPF